MRRQAGQARTPRRMNEWCSSRWRHRPPRAASRARSEQPGPRAAPRASARPSAPASSRISAGACSELLADIEVSLTGSRETPVAEPLNKFGQFQKTPEAMYRSRKSPISLALVVAMLGMSTLAPAHAPGAPGGVVHPAVVQLATADTVIRRRRYIQRAKVRAIRSRRVCRLRGAASRIYARSVSFQTRRPPSDSFSRGPPRSPGL
jgi:hypothetical protein